MAGDRSELPEFFPEWWDLCLHPAFAPTPHLNLSPATQFFAVANPSSQLTTKLLPDASLGAFGVALDWEHDALSRTSLPSFPFGMFSLVVITQVLAA